MPRVGCGKWLSCYYTATVAPIHLKFDIWLWTVPMYWSEIIHYVKVGMSFHVRRCITQFCRNKCADCVQIWWKDPLATSIPHGCGCSVFTCARAHLYSLVDKLDSRFHGGTVFAAYHVEGCLLCRLLKIQRQPAPDWRDLNGTRNPSANNHSPPQILINRRIKHPLKT